MQVKPKTASQFKAVKRLLGEARERMNMSRLFTLLGRQSGYQGVLPVGRVQTPTLRLVVDRDRSIADFVPVAYWAIDVHLLHDGQPFVAQWRAPQEACDDQDRCLNQALAQQAATLMAAAACWWRPAHRW